MLKIDVDSQRLMPVKELAARAVRAGVRIVALGQWRSPSGRGWHLVILTDPPPSNAVETVAMQLLFGSDPRREAYNLNRARAVDRGAVPAYWRERWNVLYAASHNSGTA